MERSDRVDGPVILPMVFATVALVALATALVGSVVLLVKVVRRLSRSGRATTPPRTLVLGAGDGGGTPPWADPRPAADPSPVAVATWRYRQFLRLDIEPLTAAGAAMAGIDARLVRSLVERGCPAHLALSIAEEGDARRRPPAA